MASADTIPISTNTVFCSDTDLNNLHYPVASEVAAQLDSLPQPNSSLSDSLKSPVTPAALCEANGSPALRWKSYTANKQRESECTEKPSAAAVPLDSKGKLVISLSGIPRSVMKQSSPSSHIKDAVVSDSDNMDPDVTVHRDVPTTSNDYPKANEAQEEIDAHTGSPSKSGTVSRRNGHVSILAKKICRRIKKYRRFVKPQKINGTSQCLRPAKTKHPVGQDLGSKAEAGSGKYSRRHISIEKDDETAEEMSIKDQQGCDNNVTSGDSLKGGSKVQNNESGCGNELGECKVKEVKDEDVISRDGAAKNTNKARRVAKIDGGLYTETSKLETKEQTVLETLLRDEHPAYSSEPSRSCQSGKSTKAGLSCSESDAESERRSEDAVCSQSDGSENVNTSQSREFDSNLLTPRTLGTVGKRKYLSEQVPSVLCDAEGNVWHIGKRAEQARGAAGSGHCSSSIENKLEGTGINCKQGVGEILEHDLQAISSAVAPFNHLIETRWKWPSHADYTINPILDVSNRSMVAKERSVFVGCIPDGTENLERVLHNLMAQFLERFDFAPKVLNQIQAVKIGKDYAFLELATEKVAHIVLAANQLDVFEWGVNGFHFNIEGCKSTHTSVRPLIEYMALKPATVIFVGNIPKSRWRKEYLEVFFSRLVWGSDGPADSKFVKSVYLLPESCDAYVELASELMADSVIFKCTKNPQIMADIGEDVFICRDPSSVPLMSKHKACVFPQRSLFVAVSAPSQEFKIDAIRKKLEEILPVISRETNQPGYLEYISVQPCKDYAFFQFNSEAIVDAIMDEYIENTQLFLCSGSPLAYIILRPPGYKRPGAKYISDLSSNDAKFCKGAFVHGLSTERVKERPKFKAKQPGILPAMPRRFGDEPAKKADCIMSIGASPLPVATWNGVSSAGAYSADPDSVIIVEGLPKGLSYKLLRGALNELFERILCGSGLLEVGMLLLRYLDRDGNLDVVASLPNPCIVRALLSFRRKFVVAGNEITLLPKLGKRRFNRKGNSTDCLRNQGDLSCLSDDEMELRMQRETSRYTGMYEHGVPFMNKRKMGQPKFGRPNMSQSTKVGGSDFDADGWCEEEIPGTSLSQFKRMKRETVVRSQTWAATRGVFRTALKPNVRRAATKGVTLPQQQVLSTSFKMMRARKGPAMLKSRLRSVMQVNNGTQQRKPDDDYDEGGGDDEDVPSEILRIVSTGGKRKIQAVETPSVGNRGTLMTRIIANKRRRILHGFMQKAALTQWRTRNGASF